LRERQHPDGCGPLAVLERLSRRRDALIFRSSLPNTGLRRGSPGPESYERFRRWRVGATFARTGVARHAGLERIEEIEHLAREPRAAAAGSVVDEAQHACGLELFDTSQDDAPVDAEDLAHGVGGEERMRGECPMTRPVTESPVVDT
jgi:hypothetical protein